MDIPRNLIYKSNKRGAMMIEYNSFKEMVCDEVRKKLVIDGFNVTLKVNEVDTINKKKDKLSVIDMSAPDAFPTFYMNDLYSFYENCGDLYTVIDDVVSEAKKAYNNVEKIDFSKEELSKKVFFTIINCEKNKDFLKNIPHREFQNLSIVYRVKITETSNALVTNKIAEDLNISESELYHAAYQNTPKILGNICKMNLDDWYINELKKIFNSNSSYQESVKSSDNEENKIFVFKYENNSSFGSSIILYKDTLEKTADNLKDDLVMAFPSSDELIVTSVGNGIEELKNLCYNNTNLSQKFLSNNIYIYNRREKNISIENEMMNQTLQLQSNDSRNAVHRKRI